MIEATDVEPKFRIIESGKGKKFVAISHVWAEGLGNPHGNLLPTCALKWISNHVNRFSFHSGDEPDKEEKQERPFEEAMRGKTPFWLNTICVPVAPPEMWKKAMNRLRKPYRDAALVIVLDSYLYTQDTREIDPLDMWPGSFVAAGPAACGHFKKAAWRSPGAYESFSRILPC